jgi:hypothetical protein
LVKWLNGKYAESSRLKDETKKAIGNGSWVIGYGMEKLKTRGGYEARVLD